MLGLPCMYTKKVRIPCVFTVKPGIGPTRPSARNSPLMKLVSRDLWRGGSPPSPTRIRSRDRAARWRNWSRDCADQVLSLLRSPHPQICLCMEGEGSPWVPPYVTAPAPSLWRRTVYKGLLSTYTRNFIRILYPIPRRRVRIALYNHLFARFIVTRRCSLGYKIPPWGKGLRNPMKVKKCSSYICLRWHIFPNFLNKISFWEI